MFAKYYMYHTKNCRKLLEFRQSGRISPKWQNFAISGHTALFKVTFVVRMLTECLSSTSSPTKCPNVRKMIIKSWKNHLALGKVYFSKPVSSGGEEMSTKGNKNKPPFLSISKTHTQRNWHLYWWGSVWTDCAIYWTLDNFLKSLTTINLPNSPTFLVNFCKGFKIYHLK